MRRCALLLLLAVALSNSAAAKQPNILFCLADDWGWPHATGYGDQVARTPAFDRLAREGVMFRRAFISSPSCTPSRNAILTGQQFYRLDQGANLHSTLAPEHPNFMFLLREAGYEIGHWRKAWGPGDFKAMGYKEHPCGPGMAFDKFVANRDSDKPFCFWFGTSDPHRPYKKGTGKEAGFDLEKIRVPEFYPDTPEIRSDIADYYFEVERWNKDVAAAMDLLEREGELENTIIVMTGDHGMPFPRCKGNLYDWGARVPLVVRWGERVPAGKEVDHFASFTDIAPTFLEAAGVEVPDSMSGKSLLPVLSTGADLPASESPEFIVYGRERHTPAQAMPSLDGYPARAIRTDRWLLILNLVPDRWPAGVADGATHPMDEFADCDEGPTKRYLMKHLSDPEVAKFYRLCFARRPAVELYDCQADPDQIHNLAADAEHADVVLELRQKLVEYLRETNDPRFTGEHVEFDQYPYRAGYLQKYMQEHGY
ncbi:sulfatase family protein [Aeoliella mucimassa]|uniref:Sulfatase n=1 Tax=Aeoliella mucimassa TaxID=2527972 RepID=A0A518AIS8_9BACT|nr:sulfatase [Aeoliella mucimassa]QDU54632.1 Sulfatase [Aeoliella mucimassa]